MRGIIEELRLLLCCWFFHLIIWIAPRDRPEGVKIVKAIRDWGSDILSER